MIRLSFSGERQLTNWIFASRTLPNVLDTLDDFTTGYLEAILWAETDNSNPNGGEPFDANYDITDFSGEALRRAIDDCRRFQRENAEWLVLASLPGGPPGDCTLEANAGHDFFLTRNRHGCGYWDGDWTEEAGEILTTAARAFMETSVYVGDDRKLYFH